MKKLAAIAALLPAVALAHDGPAGHAHPHGIEGVLLVALAAAGLIAWRAFKR